MDDESLKLDDTEDADDDEDDNDDKVSWHRDVRSLPWTLLWCDLQNFHVFFDVLRRRDHNSFRVQRHGTVDNVDKLRRCEGLHGLSWCEPSRFDRCWDKDVSLFASCDAARCSGVIFTTSIGLRRRNVRIQLRRPTQFLWHTTLHSNLSVRDALLENDLDLLDDVLCDMSEPVEGLISLRDALQENDPDLLNDFFHVDGLFTIRDPFLENDLDLLDVAVRVLRVADVDNLLSLHDTLFGNDLVHINDVSHDFRDDVDGLSLSANRSMDTTCSTARRELRSCGIVLTTDLVAAHDGRYQPTHHRIWEVELVPCWSTG